MYEKVILRAFIRVHILHHASREGIYGLEMIKELKSHGYDLSPGTLYPILHEMESSGLLISERKKVGGRIRRIYKTTKTGEEVLWRLKAFIREMSEEVLD
ncbi:MAG: PadR family transcriptional regulator [Thermoplasmata archaeon]|nr:MAG: PadR family transcriptional regulator [Thermoplasmata archaeon]